MAKPRRAPEELKIEEFAKRRAGATYHDASFAAKLRLYKLRQEYADVPPAYQGYLAVGICSCLESHIKYFYASASERFAEHPDLLKALYKDISVDIDTLISTTSKTFHLADVIAANIKVSSLESYRNKASTLFTVFMGNPHDDALNHRCRVAFLSAPSPGARAFHARTPTSPRTRGEVRNRLRRAGIFPLTALRRAGRG
jgi:hypothetical protein